ncbi:hypothetical protein HMI54_004225 [Coelomomyces lativittatus]|nr:hypothetical protein HMI56_003070 [Coelomomyces lativittatus]KAJ1507402.1 hypothetical protein HMI54_004225 [Coelomomyces lativittatus]KAJ1513209.1 hypothetical protein HMI55_005802 [Coelomomyces lativittatus]
MADTVDSTTLPDPVSSSTEMTVKDALQQVLKFALRHNELARGLRECVKALDSRTAQLCVLSKSCDETEYVKLIEALCHQNDIKLIEVPDSKKLGEWAGLCKYDRDGAARKVVGCSCVVVKDWGEPSESMNFVLASFDAQS